MHFEKPIISGFVDLTKPVRGFCYGKPLASREETSLREITNAFLEKKFRKIPVVDKSGHVKGIVSSVDVLDLLGGGEKYAIFKKNKKDMGLEVENFMTRHVRTINHRTSVRKTLEIFKKEGRGMYPLTDSRKLFSVISEWDFVKRVNKPLGIKVYEAMVEKPIFAKRNYSVYDVAKMMCRGGFRRLPVVEDNILLGIITPVDILSHIHENKTEKNFISDKTHVGNVMNKEVVTISDEPDLISAVDVMRNKNVGGLPVIEGDDLAGIITERDILDVLV